MLRRAAFALALVLGLAAALGLASCGGGDAKLLPGHTAAEITENLDAVKQLAGEGECESAEAAAEQVSAQVESIKGVDPKLQEALSEGAVRLNEVIGTCQEEEVEETVETETVPAVPETTDEKPDKEKKPKKEEPEPEPTGPETETTEEPEESELPPPAEGEGKGKGHAEPPGQEEEPSGGIGPGHATEGEG